MARRSSSSNLVLLVGLSVGGYFAYRSLNARANTSAQQTITGSTPSNGATPGQGNATLAPPANSSGAAPGRSASDPRGIRNNNPGNIVYNAANQWVGQIGSDGTFAKFDTMENGLRAMFILLRNYCRTYNLCTIRQISTRWAPAPANNPATYSATVARISGIPENQALSWGDASQMIRLAKGITGMENGVSWPSTIPEATYQNAFNRSV